MFHVSLRSVILSDRDDYRMKTVFSYLLLAQGALSGGGLDWDEWGDKWGRMGMVTA